MVSAWVLCKEIHSESLLLGFGISGLHQLFHILADDVVFKVDGVTCLFCAEYSLCGGMGDYGYAE